MKRISLFPIAVLIVVILFLLSTNVFASNYNESETEKGVIGIRYLNETDMRIKTRVETADNKYDYDLFGRQNYEYFPLQLGNDNYTFTIFRNIVDNRYRVVEKFTMPVIINNLLDVYKNSIQTINWQTEMDAIEKANELTKHLKTDRAKIIVIYNYVINNFSYDYEKINGLTSSYVPNIEQIFEDKKGICYDYSAVFASMLRSQKIPVKLIKGYSSNVKEYHAWNEVYLSSEKRWIIIDTTYDAVMVQNGRIVSREKDPASYKMSKEY